MSVKSKKNKDGTVTYYYDFRQNGTRYRGALEARKRAQAEKEEREKWDEIYEGRHDRPKGLRTLKDFIEKDYLPWARSEKRSWRNDRSRVKPILEYFGNKRLSDIAPFHVEAFKIKRRASQIEVRRGDVAVETRQRSKASVNRELQLLSRIFSLAIKRRQVDSNPCQASLHENGLLLKGDNRRSRILSRAEEDRLLAALTGERSYLRPIVVLALGTAMRRGNILRLKWEDVDFARACIYVNNTKSELNYDVPMNDTVRETLSELRRSSESEYVFPSPKTERAWEDPKRAFASACSEANIHGLWFHDLRRTAATRMADAGVQLAVIQGILGHSDIKTTMRYVHVLDGTKRRAVSTLEKGNNKDVVKIWSNDKEMAS